MVTTAFVGAGVVALGAQALPDAKAVNPSALAELEASIATQSDAASRAEDASRASRSDERAATMALGGEQQADIWQLPLEGYTFTTPYGMKWGKMHGGIDLAAPEGTPFHAMHAGTVTKAGWFGGYGNCVILRHADGTETIYGHSSRLLVQEGQQVQPGTPLGLVGSTGHTYSPNLHLEVHVDGRPTDPIPWLRDNKGVDIKLEVDPIYADVNPS